MSRGLVCLLAMTPTLAFGRPDAPMNWSPDGQWVAYTAATPESPATLPPGWLFDPGSDDAIHPASRLYRIYAAEADSGSTVVLEESRRPLTSPAWSPDGRALAFGRVVDDARGPAQVDWVVQNGPGSDRVILRQPLRREPKQRVQWAGLVPAWSPDGRYLVVPDFETPAGLIVVGVDQGKVLKSIERAVSPAWSPDGTKLAYIRGEKSSSLLLSEVGLRPADGGIGLSRTDLHFKAPTYLVDLGQEFQTPVWSRDGKSITAVARRTVLRGRGPTLQVDLLRVRVDSGVVETVAHFTPDPLQQEKAFRGVALSYDREVDDLFYSLDVEQHPASIVWTRPRTQETVDRFNPVDIALRIGPLSLSPNSKSLAIRFGDSGDDSTLALYDVASKGLKILADDDVSRREWIIRLLKTARRLLKSSLPTAVAVGRPVGRPTIVPVPGEIPLNTEYVVRLQRLGRLGRPLCDVRGGPATGDPKADAFLDEARLVFDALRGDYPGALEALDRVEARASTADQRERLLSLRAQFFLGMNDTEKASETVGFLRSLEDVAVSRIEVTPAGTTLTPVPSPTKGWARYLNARLDDLEKSNSLKVGGQEDMNGLPHIEPPAPPVLKGVPFERLPNGAFIAPRNGPFPAPIVDDVPNPRVRIVRPRPVSGPLPIPPPAPLPPR